MLCCACRCNKVNGQLRQDNADNLHLTTSTLSFARQAFYPHNYRGEYERFLDTKAVCGVKRRVGVILNKRTLSIQ